MFLSNIEIVSQPSESKRSVLSWIFSPPAIRILQALFYIREKSGQWVFLRYSWSPQRSVETNLFCFSAHIPIMRYIYSSPFSSFWKPWFFSLWGFSVNFNSSIPQPLEQSVCHRQFSKWCEMYNMSSVHVHSVGCIIDRFWEALPVPGLRNVTPAWGADWICDCFCCILHAGWKIRAAYRNNVHN